MAVAEADAERAHAASLHHPMEALHLDTNRIVTVCDSPTHRNDWVLWPCREARAVGLA